jgi:hypothetical protein
LTLNPGGYLRQPNKTDTRMHIKKKRGYQTHRLSRIRGSSNAHSQDKQCRAHAVMIYIFMYIHTNRRWSLFYLADVRLKSCEVLIRRR